MSVFGESMKDVLAQIVPTLRALGFKGSGQNYRKQTEGAVMVVNFQKSSGGDRFYVNLGVQPLCIPAEGGGQADPTEIKEYECVFRRRVTPPEGALGWPYDVNAATADELRGKISTAYAEYLSPLAQIPGPATELTLEQFRTQGAGSIFGGSHARNALNFARIALACGGVERARAFAEIGLADCPPMAAGLKAMLLKILKSTEPGASPNGGPAEPPAKSNTSGGPPSVRRAVRAYEK
jgi:hypothetical protein